MQFSQTEEAARLNRFSVFTVERSNSIIPRRRNHVGFS